MHDTVLQRPAYGGNIKATRDDWFGLALKTLKADGVDNVRVLPMSRVLGVSRASFYWYFASRQVLLDDLLRHWRETNTRHLIVAASRPADTITRGVLNIFENWIDEKLFDPQLDFAVRSWARRTPAVRRIVEDADKERVDAICNMYRGHGYAPQDAFVRARVLYFMQIGYYALGLHEPLDQRLSYVGGYLRSFTGREPIEAEVSTFLALAKRQGGSRKKRAPRKDDEQR
jgi:AcrR family transcriptional regulator